MRHQQQRPDVAAGTRRRWIQPGERGRQLLELARRVQLVLAAQGALHPMPHPDLLIPMHSDQPQVHVALAALDDGVALDLHAGPIPLPLRLALQHRDLHRIACNSVCWPGRQEP